MARIREPIWRVGATLNASQLINWTAYYGLKILCYVVMVVGERVLLREQGGERLDGHAEREPSPSKSGG